jgi:formylglycine-generating enzyme
MEPSKEFHRLEIGTGNANTAISFRTLRKEHSMQVQSNTHLLEQINLGMRSIPKGHVHLRNEKTRRTWRVDLEPFLLAQHVVTQELYALADATRASSAHGHPITEVSWYDAIRFCNTVSQLAGLEPCYTMHSEDEVEYHSSANGYRLPTEAEWQFACVAGTVAQKELDSIAWYRANSAQSVHPVGQKQPNAWGLYDMIGNVWEWCWDVFDPEVYGSYRVFRGGGWLDPPWNCRASCRRKSHPTFNIDDLGFRLARSLP